MLTTQGSDFFYTLKDDERKCLASIERGGQETRGRVRVAERAARLRNENKLRNARTTAVFSKLEITSERKRDQMIP